MKYFKDENGKVFAFELDGSQDAYTTDKMVQMTDDEVDRHINPEKYFSDEEKYQTYLKSLRPLTRRQFMLTLIEHGLDDDIEAAILNIDDVKQRKIINIEYRDSQTFERLSESVLFMSNLIGLEESKLNELWEHGLGL